jgi:HNH endonuclease
MVSKLLRRLTGYSVFTCEDEAPLAGLGPSSERRDRAGPVENPLPSAWVKMHVWRRDQGRCVRCGGRDRVWFEYIVAESEEGSNTEGNMRLMCEPCKRHNKGASVWRKRWRS